VASPTRLDHSPTTTGEEEAVNDDQMKQQFRLAQLESGNMQSKEGADTVVAAQVRKHLFSSCKFAMDESMFAYQPQEDQNNKVLGYMYQTTCRLMERNGKGEDEEDWQNDTKKIVKDALASKQTDVTQSIKLVMTGKRRAAKLCSHLTEWPCNHTGNPLSCVQMGGSQICSPQQ
jgi:hypothetical protein